MKFLAVFYALFGLGWLFNICQLIEMESIADTGLGVFKAIGVFIAPVGSVLGWVGLFA